MGYVEDIRLLVGHRPLILPGAVVIVLDQHDRILLQRRSDGGWGLPGGLMDLGESLEETARREVREETGLSVGELVLIDVFSGSDYFFRVSNGDELYSVTAVYISREYSGNLSPDGDESVDLGFFSQGSLPEEIAPEYRTYLETAMAGNRPAFEESNISSVLSRLGTVEKVTLSDVVVRHLREGEQPPMEILLLADPSEELVSNYIKRGNCWVAEWNHEVVGVYVLLETRPETVELVNVAVREDVQGKGIGKKLVLHAVESARDAGHRTIEVGTGNSSIGQLGLYQKCGFRIVGVDRDFFVRHYDDPIFENDIQCRDMIRLQRDL